MRLSTKIERSITWRLIFYILLFSGMITVIVTFIQIFTDYKKDVSEVYTGIRIIEESYVKPLGSAVWFINDELIRIQLEGMKHIKGIQYLEIREGDRYLASLGTPRRIDAISREFPLKYKYNQELLNIGKLIVVASLEGVLLRMKDRLLIILVSQGAKTFLVSMFMFLIFQLVVTRHLHTVASYIKSWNMNIPYNPLVLFRKKAPYTEKDELDQVVIAINDMTNRLTISYSIMNAELHLRKQAEKALQKAHEELEIHVAERTAELARMNEELQTEIAERKKIELALLKSECRLEEAQQIAHMGNYERNVLTCETFLSKELCRLFGCSSFEKTTLVELFKRQIYPDDRRQLLRDIRTTLASKSSYEFQFRYVQKNKTIRFAHTVGKVERDDHDNPLRIYGTFQDITEQKEAEEKIKIALQEKDVLLRELHHRVKNNMQVIISLMRLQANTVEEEHVAEMFREIQSRIKAMSLIHEILYQSECLAVICMKTYLSRLVNMLLRAYHHGRKNINVRVDTADICLEIDQAIPCGLIVNELISNSLKHAFHERQDHEIRIQIRKIPDNMIEMIVSDNGMGIPADFDTDNSDTLGLKLVRSLVEIQLEGHIELNRDKGTQFIIQFKSMPA